MNDLRQRLRDLPLVEPLLRHRFTKFGSVGFSGTLVNLAMLYLGQEYLFTGIEDAGTRLNVSLAVAIFVATLNNFTWNRKWTWRDRKAHIRRGLLTQLGQYFLSSWVAISLQVLLTKLLALYVHYMAANIAAIALAAVVNYLVNDAWTFGLRGRVGKGGKDAGVRS